MAVIFGGVLIQSLVGYILQAFWDGTIYNGIPIYSVHAYQVGLISIPICFGIAALTATLLIKETYCQRQCPAQ